MKRQAGSARPVTRGGAIGLAPILFLAVLLLLPGMAIHRVGTDGAGWLIAASCALVSLVTYFLYRADKRRAEGGQWRIPESTLHVAELVGGWPGAYLAQRMYRHKTAKVSYQIVFWLIVFTHQLVAGDFLADWKLVNSLILAIKTGGS